jgi:hypothetical protein
MAEDKDLRTICGWCGKSAADGAKLVAGPITCICAQCCTLAAGLLQIIPPERIPPELLADPKRIPPELLADIPPELLADSSNKPPEMAKDDDNDE